MIESRKRPSPSSPPPWQRPNKDYRRSHDQDRPKRTFEGLNQDDRVTARREQETFAREQTRRNQLQEAERMREWVSKEDDFVLQQSKKKAQIRVKEGRAKSIDWLAVTLGVIDPTKDLLDEESEGSEIDVVDPAAIFEGLAYPQLQELGRDIEAYMVLESSHSNRRYWNVGDCSNNEGYHLLTNAGIESDMQGLPGQVSSCTNTRSSFQFSVSRR